MERHRASGLDRLSCILPLALVSCVPLGHWLTSSVCFCPSVK